MDRVSIAACCWPATGTSTEISRSVPPTCPSGSPGLGGALGDRRCTTGRPPTREDLHLVEPAVAPHRLGRAQHRQAWVGGVGLVYCHGQGGGRRPPGELDRAERRAHDVAACQPDRQRFEVERDRLALARARTAPEPEITLSWAAVRASTCRSSGISWKSGGTSKPDRGRGSVRGSSSTHRAHRSLTGLRRRRRPAARRSRRPARCDRSRPNVASGRVGARPPAIAGAGPGSAGALPGLREMMSRTPASSPGLRSRAATPTSSEITVVRPPPPPGRRRYGPAPAPRLSTHSSTACVIARTARSSSSARSLSARSSRSTAADSSSNAAARSAAARCARRRSRAPGDQPAHRGPRRHRPRGRPPCRRCRRPAPAAPRAGRASRRRPCRQLDQRLLELAIWSE